MDEKYFTLIDKDESHILIHIPHSSLNIPSNMDDDYFLTKEELAKEAKIMADMFTDELFGNALNKYGGIKLDVSRVFLDVERFRDDDLESMATIGMGLAYTKTSDLKELRSLEYKKEILDIYDEYHLAFEKLVEKKLAKHNKCLIIDCHSFPSKPLPFQQGQDYQGVQICIGVEDFHRDNNFVQKIKNKFNSSFKHYKVEENTPYKGSIVPTKYYANESRVKSVMIEINRSTYMDDRNTFTKNGNFENIKKVLYNILFN
jgi:N-formylglutamate amidohydrolase